MLLLIILFCYAAILKTVWDKPPNISVSASEDPAETQMEAANSDVEDGGTHC